VVKNRRPEAMEVIKYAEVEEQEDSQEEGKEADPVQDL